MTSFEGAVGETTNVGVHEGRTAMASNHHLCRGVQTSRAKNAAASSRYSAR
jgi:hypothetical protein